MPFATSVYEELKQQYTEVTIVAVSKTKPDADILEAYEAGVRDFGENYVQELTGKYERLPKDIRWHFIGHLQTNKVKYIAPFVHLIHGIDSIKLLSELNKQSGRAERKINCLLQVHISNEETKFGFDPKELVQTDISSFNDLQVRGLMGMASFTNDDDKIRDEFKLLKNTFDQKKTTIPTFDTLSMGMSGDYKIAIQEGSNMIRVGSILFGERTKQ